MAVPESLLCSATLQSEPPQDSHYLVEKAICAAPKAGEELCGDSVRIVQQNGSTIAVLADGLGSGVKASILSTMTARIAATLFERGLPVEAVVETIGRTLPVCQVRKLAYSTFTIVQINADGSSYLVEFDNPPTIVIRDGEQLNIQRKQRIIAGHQVYEASLQLLEGDYVVAVSDGVVHAGIGGLVPLGWQWKNLANYVSRNATADETAFTMAHRVQRTVQHLYEEKPGDDSTVLVMHIRRPSKVTVVVGPPVHKTDDELVAKLLKEAAGAKVVCGGTTAGIIAREWQAPLQVDLETLDPDTPPLAYIPGVNLTTEGLITVSQALDLMKSGKPLRNTKGVPARLARLLLSADDVKFIVGRAINPAHQNPSLGGRLSLKFQVIKELQSELEKQGKNVSMVCY